MPSYNSTAWHGAGSRVYERCRVSHALLVCVTEHEHNIALLHICKPDLVPGRCAR